MRQTNEKIDPLMRIQEEIKEVVRREQEYRQLATGGATSPAPAKSYDFTDAINKSNSENLIDMESNANNLSAGAVLQATSTISPHDDNSLNTPSLASSINSKESLDEQHSDDSGISASSSPVNGTSTNNAKDSNKNVEGLKINKESRYIGPNCYNLTPEPPQQKLLPRMITNASQAQTKPRKFAVNSPQKGIMQRFIASRGKLSLSTNATQSNQILLNGKAAAALLGANSQVSPLSAPIILDSRPDFKVRDPADVVHAAVIERDSEGKPVRPGYVPVEVKIQRELKDLKSRESELKKLRKIRQSTSDLLESINDENLTDDEESDAEHCYGPGKLRTTKSISELCDYNHHSISPRATPSPDIHRSVGMRPAVSLAQLCDLDPEEAPSSHRLIQQWESLIQRNA